MRRPVTVLLLLFCSVSFLAAQEEPIKERMAVTYYRIPVRVFMKDQHVFGLSQEDFRLFENKTPRPIHSCDMKRKRMVVTRPGTGVSSAVPGRYFVLIFHINEYHDELRAGVSRLVQEILGPRDRVMAFVNDRTFFFHDLSDRDRVETNLHDLLREQSAQARARHLSVVTRVEKELGTEVIKAILVESTRGGAGSSGADKYTLYNFFKKYLVVWRDYKSRYLRPNLDHYAKFARHLEGIQREKFVINFFQMELFPRALLSSRVMREFERKIAGWEATGNTEEATFVTIIRRLMQEVERSLLVSNEFPAEEMSRLFHQVDATFHSVFLKSRRSLLSEDLSYRQVSSDMENSLRELTRMTGGKLMVSNDVFSAIGTIAEEEDVYYLLSFAPSDPDHIGEITIKASNRKFDLIYNPHVTPDHLKGLAERIDADKPALLLSGLTFAARRLRLQVSGFTLNRENKAYLNIWVRVRDEGNQTVYNEMRTLTANRDLVNVSLDLSELPAGSLKIIVDIRDLIGNTKATDILPITVTRPPPS